MKVKRIAECSPWSILQYFWPALSDNWSCFLSGCLRQVLLYNQHSIYIMHTSACVRVYVKYTKQMSTVFSLICLGPSFQKMTHHFLLHWSLRPTNLEKNLMPCRLATDHYSLVVIEQAAFREQHWHLDGWTYSNKLGGRYNYSYIWKSMWENQYTGFPT